MTRSLTVKGRFPSRRLIRLGPCHPFGLLSTAASSLHLLPSHGLSAIIRASTAVSVGFIILLSGCARRDTDELAGNPANGRRLLYSYGCGSCHTIPGVGEAEGKVGPPLSGFGSRFYIAGVLQNTPEELSRWIAQPQEVQPGNAMPDVGVTTEQARDMQHTCTRFADRTQGA
jgi:cytochrome c2